MLTEESDMRSYLLLFLLCIVPVVVFAQFDYKQHYARRCSTFSAEKPIGRRDRVMLGNSLTEGGGDWSQLSGKKRIRNRGIIGDNIAGIRARLQSVTVGKPKEIFLLIGVNDLADGASANDIVAGIRTLVQDIRMSTPRTNIYLQSLLPINEYYGRYKRLTGKTDTIPVINERLRILAEEERIRFVSLFPYFTETGTHRLHPRYTTDGLHLNAEGYRLWSDVLKTYKR